MTQAVLIDAQIREKALDPTSSFIVQAPAGSGKTALLTQRFLKLLTTVDRYPEEVLALTFTKKAAHEMRHRIIEALKLSHLPEPEGGLNRQMWQLSKRVAQRDEQAQWHLLNHPSRLKIMTIDAFCSYIVNSFPVRSEVGGTAQLAEHAYQLYQDAAQNTLLHYRESEDPNHQAHYARLLAWVDNKADKLVEMIAALLSKRDSWMPHVFAVNFKTLNREQLEAGFQAQCLWLMTRCQSDFDLEDKAQWQDILSYLDSHQHAVIFDTPELSSLAHWQFFADLVLTSDNQVRKKLTQAQGFYPQSAYSDKQAKAEAKAYKTQTLAQLEKMSSNERLVESLFLIKSLPAPRYDDKSWAVIESLGEMLAQSVVELETHFQLNHQVDFMTIAQGALMALGQSDQPSDMALKLDYQVKHVLVDEFQDTAWLQYQLFEKLVEQWAPDEGRTLFLVGDPMQSIYQFRGAEVSLFLKAQQEGLGGVHLEPLTLQCNFRSTDQIVHFVNQLSQQLFPKQACMNAGAIPFSPAVAQQQSNHEQDVQVLSHDKTSETEAFLAAVLKAQADNPHYRIAVLVRTRQQARPLIQALETAGLQLSALELEPLSGQYPVLDILSLGRALLDISHRAAWVAVLRQPLIGLSLKDIWILAKAPFESSIWENLCDEGRCADLSSEGQNRVKVILPIFMRWIDNRQRGDVSDWIQGAWLALGGQVHPIHRAVFQTLSLYEFGGTVLNWPAVMAALAQQYHSKCDHDEHAVEVLTYHKSKGLEFDVVILPGLHHQSNRRDSKLLHWMTLLTTQTRHWLLAIESMNQDAAPLQHYIQHIEKQKQRYEAIRLFYVGMTRAKKKLYLMGAWQTSEKTQQPEPVGHGLWRQVCDKTSPMDWTVLSENQPTQGRSAQKQREIIQRHQPRSAYIHPLEIDEENRQIQKEGGLIWTSERFIAKSMGIALHAWLSSITAEQWAHCTLENAYQWLNRYLKQQGLQTLLVQYDIKNTLKTILNDPKAQWIFQKTSFEKNEWSLSERIGPTKIKKHIMDRVILDDKTATYWVIDYKFMTQATPEDIIEQYQKQMLRYQNLLTRYLKSPVKAGLYCPWQGLFLEVI